MTRYFLKAAFVLLPLQSLSVHADMPCWVQNPLDSNERALCNQQNEINGYYDNQQQRGVYEGPRSGQQPTMDTNSSRTLEDRIGAARNQDLQNAEFIQLRDRANSGADMSPADWKRYEELSGRHTADQENAMGRGQAGNASGGGVATGGIPSTASGTSSSAMIKACIDEKKATVNCCSNPVMCLPGVEGGGTAVAIGVLSQMVIVNGASISMAIQGSNINKACELAKAYSFSASALNTALAANCTRKIQSCKSTCQEKQAEIEAEIPVARQQQNYSYVSQLELASRAAERNADECQSQYFAVMQYANGVTQSMMAAGIFNKCQNQTDNGPYGSGTDCSKAENQSRPECASCLLPHMKGDPRCTAATPPPYNGPPGTPPYTNVGDGGFGGGGGVGDDGGGNALTQNPDLTPVAESAGNRVDAGNGGGGGGLPGGSGGGFGGGGGGNDGSGGYNTDILKGEKGGGGYSVSSGGGYSSGGGFGGYGSGDERRDGKPFDLKSFLPGGKNDPKRGLAGLRVLGNPEIGGKQENIWERVSNRVNQLCILDRLMDCRDPKALKKLLKK